MSFDLLHIWREMSLLNKLIAGILLAMAVASLGVIIERMIALAQAAKASAAFAPKVADSVERGNFIDVPRIAKQFERSTLARLFARLCERYLDAAARPDGGLDAVEATRKENDRAQEQVSQELRRGMNVLATVGSIAPFVGLLGTVVGIIAAFQSIGASGGGGLATVSVGIAEALVETALGLMVAIPAVVAFNYLNQRVSGIEGALSRATGRLLDEMEYHHGKRDSGSYEKAAA